MHNNDKRICITEAKAVCDALRKGQSLYKQAMSVSERVFIPVICVISCGTKTSNQDILNVVHSVH